MRKRIGILLGAILAGFACVYLWNAACLFLNQSEMIYYPKSEWAGTPASVGLDYEEAAFDTADGTGAHGNAPLLSGWFVPAKDRPFDSAQGKGVILLCHGNAGNISNRLDELRIFHELGFGAFIFDYRGYGKSLGGPPTEEGTYRDAEAAWRYLTEKRGIAPQDIVICGRSLGAAIAAYLASREDPRALIVESGFVSLVQMGSERYPYFPVKWLLKFRYDTLGHLKKVRCPVLIVHSREDDLVPFHHGQALFQAANEPKEFLEISGSHNQGFLASEERYKRGLKGFLEKGSSIKKRVVWESRLSP